METQTQSADSKNRIRPYFLVYATNENEHFGGISEQPIGWRDNDCGYGIMVGYKVTHKNGRIEWKTDQVFRASLGDVHFLRDCIREVPTGPSKFPNSENGWKELLIKILDGDI